MLSKNPVAIKYALTQLLRRAGVLAEHSLPIEITYGDTLRESKRACINIKSCDDEDWVNLLTCPPNSLTWLPIQDVLPSNYEVPFSEPVPVLFWGAGVQHGAPFVEHYSKGIVINADIIVATLFMLSRWEETVTSALDVHGRFPATASVAYKQGFLDRPIVDEYAFILQAWLRVLCPNWVPKSPQFSVKISHDIDHVYRFSNWRMALRMMAHYVLKQRDFSMAYAVGRDIFFRLCAPERTTYIENIWRLASISTKYHLGTDAFYFMATEPGPYDSGYDPAAPPVKKIIENLKRQGFEIGLHAGYETLNRPGKLSEEKERLEKLLGESHIGGRQHYLRFEVPETWRLWESAGFSYDATMGYADVPGFRCGTCHPYRPFDIMQNRELDLWEIPLIVMDRTLKQYLNLSPEQAENLMLTLVAHCKRVNGVFTLLWHNSLMDEEWQPWVNMYTRLIKHLSDMGAVPYRPPMIS